MTSSRELYASGYAEAIPRTVVPLPGGRSIAYAQTGSGPDCLVIHGTLMTLEDAWLGPVPALADRLRVTAVDRPGHGLSKRCRLIDASPWRQAEILHAFAGAIGLHRPIIIGHSFGGTVALAYAMLFPEAVSGVVALASPCLPETRFEAMLFGPRALPWFGEGLASVLGATIDPLLLQALWRAMFLPQLMPGQFATAFPFALASRAEQMIAEGEDAAALMPALLLMGARCAGCRVPIRFLGGTADIVVNNAMQSQIAAALMPQASFTWLPGSGHMLHHFEQDRILEAVDSLPDG